MIWTSDTSWGDVEFQYVTPENLRIEVGDLPWWRLN
jgi:hypothetical protein